MLTGPRLRHALAALMIAASSACSERRDPIIIQEGQLVVENQTSTEWRNVVITVNDHFRGGARSLLPGGRVHAPLNELQTGFGQRYDRNRMSVFKVDVTATDVEGKPVTLHWGK